MPPATAKPAEGPLSCEASSVVSNAASRGAPCQRATAWAASAVQTLAVIGLYRNHRHAMRDRCIRLC